MGFPHPKYPHTLLCSQACMPGQDKEVRQTGGSGSPRARFTAVKGVTVSESASTSVAGSTRSVFTRTASGLVREMSLWDAALYGIFATGGVYAFVYLFPFPQALSPGVNVPLLIVLTLALGLLVYFAYAALGSALPRAGGDYVYETRT